MSDTERWLLDINIIQSSTQRICVLEVTEKTRELLIPEEGQTNES